MHTDATHAALQSMQRSSDRRMSLVFLFLSKGTIKGKGEDEFDAEASAQTLRAAFKGLGTDEKTIVDVLVAHTNAQRQSIKKKYKTMFGKDLISDMEEELGGHFLEVALALMCPSHLFDAHCVRKALMGKGTDENCLIEIFCTRTNSEIDQLKDAYFAEFRRNLEGDVLAETSGDFSPFLVSLLNANREEKKALDKSVAEQDAAKLHAAGVQKLGTDEAIFNHILCLRSLPQIALTIDEYKKRTGRELEHDIRKEFSDDMRDGLIAIVKIAKSTPSFFAERLHSCLKGTGTDDDTLIRIIVSRSELDMEQIKEDYQVKYKKTLAKGIKDDCSGDYARLLLKVIASNNL